MQAAYDGNRVTDQLGGAIPYEEILDVDTTVYSTGSLVGDNELTRIKEVQRAVVGSVGKGKLSLIYNCSVVQLQFSCKFPEEATLLENYVLVDSVIR